MSLIRQYELYILCVNVTVRKSFFFFFFFFFFGFIFRPAIFKWVKHFAKKFKKENNGGPVCFLPLAPQTLATVTPLWLRLTCLTY